MGSRFEGIVFKWNSLGKKLIQVIEQKQKRVTEWAVTVSIVRKYQAEGTMNAMTLTQKCFYTEIKSVPHMEWNAYGKYWRCAKRGSNESDHIGPLSQATLRSLVHNVDCVGNRWRIQSKGRTLLDIFQYHWSVNMLKIVWSVFFRLGKWLFKKTESRSSHNGLT